MILKINMQNVIQFFSFYNYPFYIFHIKTNANRNNFHVKDFTIKLYFSFIFEVWNSAIQMVVHNNLLALYMVEFWYFWYLQI